MMWNNNPVSGTRVPPYFMATLSLPEKLPSVFLKKTSNRPVLLFFHHNYML